MFKECLDAGMQVERKFAEKLLKYSNVKKIEFAPNREFKDRDIKATIEREWWDEEVLFEIKRDFKSQETWNIALEIKCNWKPSGIFASKADYIIYCLSEDEFYFRNRWELLYDLCDIAKYKTLGWDWERAEMYIISKELLPILFRKLQWEWWND